MDVLDIGVDAYALHTSIQEFKAAFAGNNDLKGLHDASVQLRTARAFALSEYVRRTASHLLHTCRLMHPCSLMHPCHLMRERGLSGGGAHMP